MVRPIFEHEVISDPDFAWLLERFQESHPNYLMVQGSLAPVILIQIDPSNAKALPQLPSTYSSSVAFGDAALPGIPEDGEPSGDD